ncbi:hypothetical protein WCLP8_4600002 [uncultured Gammaproteobacteria bacterium]
MLLLQLAKDSLRWLVTKVTVPWLGGFVTVAVGADLALHIPGLS